MFERNFQGFGEAVTKTLTLLRTKDKALKSEAETTACIRELTLIRRHTFEAREAFLAELRKAKLLTPSPSAEERLLRTSDESEDLKNSWGAE